MAVTRKSPSVPRTVEPVSTSMPARRAASGRAPAASARRSATTSDLDARALEIQRRLVGIVAAGHDDRARADAHAEAVQIGVRCAGQHDARPIVARENQRPLDGAGGEHDRSRANLPEPLARLLRGRARQMIVEPLRQTDEIVREVAEGGAACEQSDAIVAGELGEALLQPLVRAQAVDRGTGVRQQAAAQLGGFVAQDDPGAGLPLPPAPRRCPRGLRRRRVRRNAHSAAHSGPDRHARARGRGPPRGESRARTAIATPCAAT